MAEEEDELVFNMDASDVKPEDIDHGGGLVDQEGNYHFVCNGVTKFKEDGKLPNVRVDFQCAAGDHEKQVNKMLFHRIYLASWQTKPNKDKGIEGVLAPLSTESKKILLRFSIGMGIISKEDCGNANLRIPFNLLPGRQMCCKVKKEQKKDSDGKKIEEFDFRIPYGEVYPVNHPSVEKTPKDGELVSVAPPPVGNADPNKPGEFDDI